MSQFPPDPSNPYSSHGYTPAGYTPGAGPQHPLVGQFKIIGIIFIVLSIIGFFGALVTSLGNILQIAQGGPKPPQAWTQPELMAFTLDSMLRSLALAFRFCFSR